MSSSSETVNEEHGRGRRRSSSVSQIQQLDQIDAEERYEVEEADRGLGALHNIRSRTRSRPNETVISWAVDDPENPYNWSTAKKSLILFFTAMLILNSTMGSALPSMAIPAIAKEFGMVDQEQMVLPISVFLIGYVFGPIIWGPLSEHFGRRNLILATFFVFCVFTMACALAPNWPALLVFRLFCGVTASAPIAVVAGILADVYSDPQTRGRAFAIFMVATVFGPLLSPIISGFSTNTIGWRWTFWIGLIYAGATFALVILLPETYGPILLARRAAKMRKEHTEGPIPVAPRDLETTDMNQLFRVVLTRPLRMIVSELIVSTVCVYLALVYAIFYMSFQAFPIIFQDLYGLSPGVTGLVYLSIGGGAILSLAVFWTWDAVLARARAQNKDWVKREEYRRLPLAVIGGPTFFVSLFWLGFTAKKEISFVVPMLAGIPFGLGFMLIFMALLNYLTDAYEIFAASANAASSTCRSLLAVILPLATSKMFENLGISGACALLGGLCGGMCLIPFIFIWKGPSIRARSKFCLALKERKEAMMRKEEEERARMDRRAQREKEEKAEV